MNAPHKPPHVEDDNYRSSEICELRHKPIWKRATLATWLSTATLAVVTAGAAVSGLSAKAQYNMSSQAVESSQEAVRASGTNAKDIQIEVVKREALEAIVKRMDSTLETISTAQRKDSGKLDRLLGMHAKGDKEQ